MSTKTEILEGLLTTVVESFLKSGKKLQSNSFGSVASGCACPLEVLLASVAKTEAGVHVGEGAELLSKTTNLLFSRGELWEFVYGYDNAPDFRITEFYSLGQKFRSKYPPHNEQTTAGQL